MFKKLLAGFGIGLAATGSASSAEFYKPYTQSHANFLYNLLFCDDIDLFKNNDFTERAGPWSILMASKPDIDALRKVAEDEGNEGRVRALAFNAIRGAGVKVSAKKILGVIVEVPLKNGLDTLAAFSEGGVRYLNQSGKVAIFEGKGNPVEELAMELVAVAQPVVNQIGPWDRKRMPPPKLGNVRMTFLVSDGLYFGEGPFDAIQRDAMGGPVLAKATQLLQKAIELGTK